MNRDRQTQVLLLIIAIALSIIALRPFIAPVTAQAVSGDGYPVYIEPGTIMLRAPDGSKQVFGKMVVDLRTGKIWGFPTTTQAPYPVNATQSKPPTSQPFLLGTFALDGMTQ